MYAVYFMLSVTHIITSYNQYYQTPANILASATCFQFLFLSFSTIKFGERGKK